MLRESGLAVALAALAERRILRVGDMPEKRYPPEVESTVYRLAALASERSPTNVSIVDHDATTTVQVDVDAELPDLIEVRDRTTTLNGQLIVSPGDASTRINARPPDTTRCLNAAGRRPHAERCLQHRVGAGVRCLRQLQIRPERSVQLLVHEEPSQ